MDNSLFVSFELHSPSANYGAVEEAVAKLGHGVRVHTYFWFVKSPLGATEAAARLWQIMDERDSVLVVDASNHEAGWKHISQDASEIIKRQWRSVGVVEGSTGPVLPKPKGRPELGVLLRPGEPPRKFDEP